MILEFSLSLSAPYHLSDPYHLLNLYHLSVTASMWHSSLTYFLRIASRLSHMSLSTLTCFFRITSSYCINESFNFDFLFSHHLSVSALTFSFTSLSLSTLTCFLQYRLSVTTSVSLSALICFFRITFQLQH